MKRAGQVSKQGRCCDSGTREKFPLKYIGKCGPGTVLSLSTAPKNGQENEDATLPVTAFMSAMRPLATAMKLVM